MMKILYLIPPSEGKAWWWNLWTEKVNFKFQKPLDILESVTEKDLKCSGKRFEEAKFLHQKIISWEILGVMLAIERYNGVMYSAIDYVWMNDETRAYFDKHFLITSGLYGLLTPRDVIANYKLPVEAQWVARYWKDILSQALNELDIDIIIDLLPGSYKKMIDWKQVKVHRVEIEFSISKSGKIQKLTHGVKKVKGDYIKNICIERYTDISDFPWELKVHSKKHSIISIFSQ